MGGCSRRHKGLGVVHKVFREGPHGEVRVRGQGEHMVLRFQVESAWFVLDAAEIWCNEGAYTFVFQRRVC